MEDPAHSAPWRLLGARERTQAEFRDLLERGGFQMEGVASTGSPAGLAVIEATPT